MSVAADRDLKPVKGLAATASTFAVIAIVLLLVGTIWNYMIEPCIAYLRTLRSEPAFGPFWPVQVIGPQLILALPSFLFINALGALRKALDEYAAGRFFTTASGANVQRAGDITIVAIIFETIASPTLFNWVAGERPGIEINFESFHLGLIAFAICVSCIGRVLVSAAAIKAENDQIV
jgi:hypothetical protein